MTDASTTGAVERLSPCVHALDETRAKMRPNPNGAYVAYWDYTALVAERDAAIQRAEAAEADKLKLAQQFDKYHPDPALMSRIILNGYEHEFRAEQAEAEVAAQTARLDAELERIIGEVKSIIEEQSWSGGGLTDAAMEQMMHRLAALRRAAPTEGEA